MLIELTEDNFKDEIKTGVKLVEFYTSWCGYCKKQQPELEAMDKVRIGQADADKLPLIAAEYRINAFPTFLIMKDGKEVERFSGMHKKEIIMEKIMNHIS
jgi:thioredoxin 1